MTGASFVPMAGVGPDTEPRVTRSGIAHGVTHAVPEGQEPFRVTTLGGAYVAVCGRSVVPVVTFYSSDWPKLRDRDHKRYQTGVCARCAKLTRPAELEGEELARAHSPRDWFRRGAWPSCSCGVAPRDNAALSAHWSSVGLAWHDDGGQLKWSRIQG